MWWGCNMWRSSLMVSSNSMFINCFDTNTWYDIHSIRETEEAGLQAAKMEWIRHDLPSGDVTMSHHLYPTQSWLVGGWPTPPKNMSSSMGRMTSHIWNGKKMFETTNQLIMNLGSVIFDSSIYRGFLLLDNSWWIPAAPPSYVQRWW